MANLLRRIEKKLIIKNTLFIFNGVPRLSKNSKNIKITFTGDEALSEMLKLNKSIFEGFNSRTSVLIKINLNSPQPYPASTSSEMLEAVLQSLLSLGVREICIGDCSGLVHLPTRIVINKKGLGYFKKYGAKIKFFDYGRWVNIAIKGIYFKNIIISEIVYKYDKIINLANLKSHHQAGFSFSTKLLVGFMHPFQRIQLHKDHLQERIAELSMAVQPDISIIDARKIFIDGGPDFGKVAEAKTIIVNDDLFEADLAAYNLLFSVKNQNRIDDLDENPNNSIFFKHYSRIKDNF